MKRSQHRVTAVKVLFVSSGKNGKPGQVVISRESHEEAGIEVDYLFPPGIQDISAVPPSGEPGRVAVRLGACPLQPECLAASLAGDFAGGVTDGV